MACFAGTVAKRRPSPLRGNDTPAPSTRPSPPPPRPFLRPSLLPLCALLLCAAFCVAPHPLHAAPSTSKRSATSAAATPHIERGWYHTINPGETLPILANRYGVELRYLAKVNGLQTYSAIRAGSRLFIPPHSGHYHRVASGETLSSIARKYSVDLDSLTSTNRISRSATLKIGTLLIVPSRLRPPPSGPSAPATSKISAAKRSFPAPKKSPAKSPSNAVAAPVRTPAPQQSRISGIVSGPSPTERDEGATPGGGGPISALASREPSPEPAPIQQLPQSQPIAQSPPPKKSASAPSAASPAASPARSAPRGRPDFRWPLEGTVTRGYVNTTEAKHRGLDIAVPEGTPIRASADGKVIYSGDDIPGYGRMVILDHSNGWASCYAHNKTNLVKVDERVRAGDVIARVGSTGRSTGPHLHFEIRHNLEAVDPLPFLP